MGKPAVYLTPAEAAEHSGNAVTVGTLANWRTQKKGPPYVKFGTRVRYPLAKFEEWAAKNEHLVPSNDNDGNTERETDKS